MADKVKVNIYLPPDMLTALKRLAAMMDRPYAEVVRVACKQYILAHAESIAAERKALNKVASE